MTLSTRLAAAMIGLVLFTAAAISVLVYRDLASAILPQALERLKASATLRAAEVDTLVRSARADVFGFRAAAALDGIIRARLGGGDEGLWRQRMARRFSAELEVKPSYLEFSVISADDGKRELVRVVRSGDGVRIVPDVQLERRGDQAYVREALARRPGEVYVSPIERIPVRDGAISPHVPAQHVAMSLQNPDGSPFGVLHIALDLRPLFDRLRGEIRRGREIYLVNEGGEFLLHPDPAREYTSPVDDGDIIQHLFPGIAAALSESVPNAGMYDDGGERYAAATASVNFSGDSRAILVETLPYSVIMQPADALAWSMLMAALIAVLAAIAIAIILSRSLSRSLTEIASAVQAFGHGEELLVPTEAGGEVGVLARAFVSMASEVKDKSAALTREIEERRRLFDTTLDLILIVDRRGALIRVSPSSEAILGYRAEELVGRNAVEFVHPDDLASVRNEMRLARRGRHIRDFETRYIHADGHAVTLAWTGVWSETGQQHFFIGRDVSERKRVERLKDEFVSTVSHELRTPLTSIAGSLGLLAGGAAGTIKEPAMRLLTIARKNSERLVRLINDILDIEKIESGKMQFNFAKVELRAVVEQAIEGHRGFAESYGVKMVLAPESDSCHVRADIDRLTQVMSNLLSNAVKFSPPGGVVEVATARHDHAVVVTVRDHGPGIPEAFQPRVFEKFAQADATDTRQKGGTGLGLSIVKQIVTILNGRVMFECPPEGGTCFTVELPVWDASAAAADGRAPAQVLICDDDRDVGRLLADHLAESGLIADIAVTAEQAVTMASQTIYDAILVDLMLPDRDGISLIQDLRGHQRTARTPIVVISFDTQRGREDIRSSSLDVLDWLDKPIDIGHLLTVLDRPLGAGDARRPRVLHVDDDPNVLALVAQSLHATATVTSAMSAADARSALAEGAFDLVVLDIALSTGSGLDLLPELKDRDGRAIPVIIYSAQGANRDFATQVQAALTKSRSSIAGLISTLRRHIAEAHEQSADQEVA